MDGIATQSAQIVSPSAGGIAFGNASRLFNGTSNSIASASAPAISGSDARTIAFWLKTSAAGGAAVAFGNLTGSAQRFLIFVADGTSFGRTIGGVFIDINGALTASTTRVDNGIWNHVAVVYSSGGLITGTTIYVNGSPTTTNSTTSNLTPATGTQYPVVIGRALAVSNFFQGNLADIRIYNAALSSGDVASLAAGAHVSSNLIGWWLLNNDDVLDYSGSGNDGTNDGSTYSTDGPLD